MHVGIACAEAPAQASDVGKVVWLSAAAAVAAILHISEQCRRVVFEFLEPTRVECAEGGVAKVLPLLG